MRVCFYFRPHILATVAPHYSQPLASDMARVFFHLVLLHSFLLTPSGSNPQSRSKWELPLPSLHNQFDHNYQAAANWWEKEALSTQTASFPLGSSPNISCQIVASGTLFQAGNFAAAPIPSKTATSSRFRVPFLDSIKSNFLAIRKVADSLWVQNLLLFLQDCVEEFQ